MGKKKNNSILGLFWCQLWRINLGGASSEVRRKRSIHSEKENYSSVTATLTRHNINSWQGNLRIIH